TPPDPNGDVGPNHYVQVVNFSFAVFDKAGNRLTAPRLIHTLFSGLPIPNDPAPPYYQCVAISQTGDPTGAYNLYSFIVSSAKFNDYVKWGVWPDGYYMR